MNPAELECSPEPHHPGWNIAGSTAMPLSPFALLLSELEVMCGEDWAGCRLLGPL